MGILNGLAWFIYRIMHDSGVGLGLKMLSLDALGLRTGLFKPPILHYPVDKPR